MNEKYPHGKSKQIKKRYEEIVKKERRPTIKSNYKSVCERFTKANDFYEDDKIPKAKKEKFYPEYEELLVEAEAYRRAYDEILLEENQINMKDIV